MGRGTGERATVFKRFPSPFGRNLSRISRLDFLFDEWLAHTVVDKATLVLKSNKLLPDASETCIAGHAAMTDAVGRYAKNS